MRAIWYEGKFVCVYFKDKPIAHGKVCSIKSNPDCISVEDNYYWSLNSPNIKVELTQECATFCNKQLLGSCKIIKWNSTDNCTRPDGQTIDCIKDYSIYELDKEIEPIVMTINRVQHCRTFASCGGHIGIGFPFVSIAFTDVSSIALFCMLLGKLNGLTLSQFHNTEVITEKPKECCLSILPTDTALTEQAIVNSRKLFNRLNLLLTEYIEQNPRWLDSTQAIKVK